MTRLNAVLVAAGLAVGAVGCAHCDTCDDFPAPCVGPNCGGQYGAYATGNQPAPYAGPTTTTTTTVAPGASLGPVIDSVGPAPTVPGGATSTPGTPAVNPAPAGATPPPPGEPTGPRPTRPGA
jgi:hypothetical protein